MLSRDMFVRVSVRMCVCVCVCVCEYICVDKQKPWMFQLSCGPCTKQNGQVRSLAPRPDTYCVCFARKTLCVYMCIGKGLHTLKRTLTRSRPKTCVHINNIYVSTDVHFINNIIYICVCVLFIGMVSVSCVYTYTYNNTTTDVVKRFFYYYYNNYYIILPTDFFSYYRYYYYL